MIQQKFFPCSISLLCVFHGEKKKKSRFSLRNQRLFLSGFFDSCFILGNSAYGFRQEGSKIEDLWIYTFMCRYDVLYTKVASIISVISGKCSIPSCVSSTVLSVEDTAGIKCYNSFPITRLSMGWRSSWVKGGNSL